jgi:hypothetical protein
MRISLSGFLSRVNSYEVSRFLSGFPHCVSPAGFRLVSRVDRGRAVWRVERAESGIVEGSDCEGGAVHLPSGITPAALLPAPAQDATPCPDLSPAEMLAANLRKSLQRQAELLDLPLNPEDTRLSRLISDVANQTLSAALRTSEETLRAKRDGSREISPYLQSRVEEAERRVQKLKSDA